MSFLCQAMAIEDGEESMALLDCNHPIAGLPSPPVKPEGGAWLLSFLLRAIVMAIALALFFILAGIAVFFLLILCLIGRVLRRRRRLFQAMIGPSASESHGLSLEELQCLPCFSYSGLPDTQDCAVCLEGFMEGGWCRALPGCNHVFHRLCVDRWLERSPLCPICRGRVKSWPPLDRPLGCILDAENRLSWSSHNEERHGDGSEVAGCISR